jgi:hypothetical protein
MTRVNARTKGVVVIDDAAMDRVAFKDDYAKGRPITVSNTIDRAVGLSLSLGAGGQATLSGVDDGGLFPSLPLLVLDARVHNLLRSQLTLDVDAGFGSVAATRVVDGGGLGTLSFPVQASLLQGGVAVLWEQPLEELIGQEVTVGLGPRMAGLLYVHKFTGGGNTPAGLEQQTYLTFTPGLSGFVAWSPVSFAHLEVGGRASYLAYNVDELRHLGVVEAFASVWLDL